MYALPHIECGPYWTCHSDMSHFTITRVGLLGTCNIYGKVEEMSQHAINSTALYFVHCVWHMHFAQPKMMLFGLFKCSPCPAMQYCQACKGCLQTEVCKMILMVENKSQIKYPNYSNNAHPQINRA